MKFRKVLAVIMSIVMLLGYTGVFASATNGSVLIDGVKFNTDKTVLIKYPQNKTNTSYIIPDTVKTIGSAAFFGCNNLTTVIIPNGVTDIGHSAFSECRNLTTITIPNSVVTIGTDAFLDCINLDDVTIPASVKSIGVDAFMKAYKVDANNPTYSSSNGVLFNKDKTVLIEYPYYKNDVSYTIPDTVTAIEGRAFYSCDKFLEEVIIPHSVAVIGDYAFRFCGNLKSVVIPNGTIKIEEYAFDSCTNLKEVTIPNSVTEIGNFAFGFTAEGQKVDGFHIKCEKNSAAHNYAIKNGFAVEFITPTTEPTDHANAPYFEIAKPDKFIEGQEVNIDFNLKNASKFTSGTGQITYDNKVLEFVEIVKTAGETFQAGKVCIKDNAVGWAGAVETSFGEDICNLATVKFKVIGAGASRSSIEISVIDNDFFVDDTYCELAPIKADFTVEAAVPLTEPSRPADPTTELPKPTDPTTEPTKPIDPTTEPTKPTDPTSEPTQPTTTPVQDETELKPAHGADIRVNNIEKTVTILPKTTVDGFKKLVTNSANTVSIAGKDGKELSADAKLVTGAKVRVLGSDGKVLSEYKVIVPFDNNGDGKVNSSDARNALRNAAKLSILRGVYFKASDFNGDGKANSSDARTMLRVSAKLEALKPEILDIMIR